MKFSFKDFFSKFGFGHIQETSDFVTFTEKVINRKLYVCAVHTSTQFKQQIFANQSKSNNTHSNLVTNKSIPSLEKQWCELHNLKTPDLHQNNKENNAFHCMMRKELELATSCPGNMWSKGCNGNWIYCEKPSQNRTRRLHLLRENQVILIATLLSWNPALLLRIMWQMCYENNWMTRNSTLAYHVLCIRDCQNETKVFVKISVIDICKFQI